MLKKTVAKALSTAEAEIQKTSIVAGYTSFKSIKALSYTRFNNAKLEKVL